MFDFNSIALATEFIVDNLIYTVCSTNIPSVTVVGITNYEEKIDLNIPSEVTWDGIIYHVTSIYDEAFKGSNIVSLKINSDIKIGKESFADCSSLISVAFPDNLSSLGLKSFYNSAIESISIPSTIVDWEPQTFMKCRYLKNVYLKDGLTTIGTLAFAESGVTSITIPESLQIFRKDKTEFGQGWNGAFRNCSNLELITLQDGVTTTSDMFSNCGVKEVSLPSSMIYATFGGCKNLTHLSLPEGLVDIGMPNSGIKEINLPSSIKVATFSDCPNLTKVIFNNDIDPCVEFDFKDCINLVDIHLPSTLKIIPYGAFENCSKLSDIELPESLEKIGGRAFARTNINKIKIHPALKDWGLVNYNGVLQGHHFAECDNLTEIIIEEGVESIGMTSFYGNSNISSIILPSSISNIGDKAFYNCSQLENIICKGIIPPSGGEKIFDFTRYQTLHVPYGLEKTYRNQYPWSEFLIIFEDADKYTSNVKEITDNNESKYYSIIDNIVYFRNGIAGEIYNNNGLLIYQGNKQYHFDFKGMYIIVVDNKTYKVLI